MAGFLSGVSDLLSNPAIQQLIPAIAGAAGGALTSPRLAGARGSIGRGLLGGAEGLAQGQQAAAYGQEAKLRQAQLQHTQMEDQIAAYNLKTAKDAATRLTDLRAQHPELSGLNDADFYNSAVHLPALKNQLKVAAANPDPRLAAFTSRLKGVDYASLDFDSAKTWLDAYAKFKEAPAEPMVQIKGPSGNAIWVPRSMGAGKEVAPPKEDPDLAALRGANLQKAKMEMDGTLPPRAGAKPKWATYQDPSGNTHTVDTNTTPPEPNWVPYKAPTTESASKQSGDVAGTIKKLTPTGYAVKSISADDTVTLHKPWSLSPDITVSVPGAHKFMTSYGGGSKSVDPNAEADEFEKANARR